MRREREREKLAEQSHGRGWGRIVDGGWNRLVDFTAIPLVTARRGSVLSSWPVLTVSHL